MMFLNKSVKRLLQPSILPDKGRGVLWFRAQISKVVFRYALVCIALLLGVMPPLALAKTFDRVVAKVNNEIITMSGLAERM